MIFYFAQSSQSYYFDFSVPLSNIYVLYITLGKACENIKRLYFYFFTTCISCNSLKVNDDKLIIK